MFISDFAPYKPTHISSEDIGECQFFFGDSSCLAPEKLVSPEKRSESVTPATLQELQAMDIFSLGCVLAEIFLNGHALFDLAKLQSYKKHLYSPENVLSSIECPQIKQLILSMISLDPIERRTAREYLIAVTEQIMPSAFTHFLYYFMAIAVHPGVSSSDKRTALVFTHLEAIWQCCFRKSAPPIAQTVNSVVFESIRDLPFRYILDNIVPGGLSYCVTYDDCTRFSNPPEFPLTFSYFITR